MFPAAPLVSVNLYWRLFVFCNNTCLSWILDQNLALVAHLKKWMWDSLMSYISLHGEAQTFNRRNRKKTTFLTLVLHVWDMRNISSSLRYLFCAECCWLNWRLIRTRGPSSHQLTTKLSPDTGRSSRSPWTSPPSERSSPTTSMFVSPSVLVFQ